MCSGYCRLGEWECSLGGQCVSERVRCDGKVDCGDGSDEDPAHCNRGGLNLRTYPTEQTIKEGKAGRAKGTNESSLFRVWCSYYYSISI